MIGFLSRLRSGGGMTAAQAVGASGPVVLIDVREPEEIRATGKAAGALCFPMATLPRRADPARPDVDARLDPKATICVYCAAGGRAGTARRMLKQLGYRNVHNIGGFGDWVRAGGTVEPG